MPSILVLAFFLGMSDAQSESSPIQVRIINGFSSQNVYVHCRSANEDIGLHLLTPGNDIRWEFHINFSGTTLFYCHAWWGNEYQWFDAFKIDYLFTKKCDSECFWRLSEDGIYQHNEKKEAWELEFPWKGL